MSTTGHRIYLHLPLSFFSHDPSALGTHSFHHLSWATEAFVSVGFEVGPLNTDYYTLLFYFILRYITATALNSFDIFLLHVESIKTLTATPLLHQASYQGRLIPRPLWALCVSGVHSALHGARCGSGTGYAVIVLKSTKLITYSLLLITGHGPPAGSTCYMLHFWVAVPAGYSLPGHVQGQAWT